MAAVPKMSMSFWLLLISTHPAQIPSCMNDEWTSLHQHTPISSTPKCCLGFFCFVCFFSLFFFCLFFMWIYVLLFNSINLFHWSSDLGAKYKIYNIWENFLPHSLLKQGPWAMDITAHWLFCYCLSFAVPPYNLFPSRSCNQRVSL